MGKSNVVGSLFYFIPCCKPDLLLFDHCVRSIHPSHTKVKQSTHLNVNLQDAVGDMIAEANQLLAQVQRTYA